MQAPGIFEEDFISKQLKSSGVDAFYELMQIGFASKVEISVLFEDIKSLLTPQQISLGESMCCRILFLAFGFTTKGFRIGKTEVLIRPGQTHLSDRLYADLKYSKEELKLKFKSSFWNFMRKIMFIRFRFLGKCKFSSYFLQY